MDYTEITKDDRFIINSIDKIDKRNIKSGDEIIMRSDKVIIKPSSPQL